MTASQSQILICDYKRTIFERRKPLFGFRFSSGDEGLFCDTIFPKKPSCPFARKRRAMTGFIRVPLTNLRRKSSGESFRCESKEPRPTALHGRSQTRVFRILRCTERRKTAAKSIGRYSRGGAIRPFGICLPIRRTKAVRCSTGVPRFLIKTTAPIGGRKKNGSSKKKPTSRS